jgi:hypothetical protein
VAIAERFEEEEGDNGGGCCFEVVLFNGDLVGCVI